jgi:hypothetical protein
MGGRFHLKLNTGERPIANKYREGKMKRTLKRELKVLETAKREALETSHAGHYLRFRGSRAFLSCAQARRGGSWLSDLTIAIGGSESVTLAGESQGEGRDACACVQVLL